ncbi:hypothetical protein BKA64DRAFT_154737 [Cadophora sp. MPI-SDFR-AT-0126]|nr:hypothetical protein BKA64DRAFT_154737 [Leotiomycetes sp. MPI-SDFR-AT-0126]
MSSTPQGSKSGTSKYYGDGANGSFANRSRVDVSTGDQVTTTSVAQPHYPTYRYISEASQSGTERATISFDTNYEPSMASAPSADYVNGYSVQGTAWQPQAQDPFGSGSEDFGCISCAQRFRRRADLDRHERTIHVNNAARPYKCEVRDCPAGVTSWTKLERLQAHNEEWHGGTFATGSSNKGEELYRDQPPDFSSQTIQSYTTESPPSSTAATDPSNALSGFTHLSLGTDANFVSSSDFKSAHPKSSRQAASRHISSRNPSTMREELDPNYKVHKAFEFKFGRVFKVLWSEPLGLGNNGNDSDGEVSLEARPRHLGVKSFSKIRRFVIINAMRGHCICLPILTYTGQGVTKNGVHADDHAPIRTKDSKVVYAKGEREMGLTRKPIEIECLAGHKLDPLSRLNYAKTYTVEHNVKVCFIGKVANRSERYLVADFNDVHPPLVQRSPEDDSGRETAGNPQLNSTKRPGSLYDNEAVMPGAFIQIESASSSSLPTWQPASSSPLPTWQPTSPSSLPTWQQFPEQYEMSSPRMPKEFNYTENEEDDGNYGEKDLYSAD